MAIIITNQHKVDRLKAVDSRHLHVVTDYDHTLTQASLNGERLPTSLSLFRHGNYLTDEYPKKAYALFDTYAPIERDHTIDPNYKLSKVVEWWSRHEQLLIESGLTEEVIQQAVREHPGLLRGGVKELLSLLHKQEIPLLIFSAGLGNVIEEYLDLTDNVHVLSNVMEFHDGRAIGYRDAIIHTMNKSEKNHPEFLSLIKERPNAVLIGDSLHDVDMVDENKMATVLRVGLLNDGDEERLQAYKEAFDVVITQDGDLHWVVDLLQEVCNDI